MTAGESGRALWRRASTPVLAGVCVVALAHAWLRLWGESPGATISPDEFQHVHVAWNSAAGRLIYRDFADNHGALSSWLNGLALLLRGEAAASYDSLFVLRRLQLGYLFAQMLAVAAIARHVTRSWVAGLFAAAVLVSSRYVHSAYVLHVRPDTLQTTFLLFGVWALFVRRSFVAGVLFGFAWLVHPKVVATLFLLGVACVVAVRFDGRPRPWLRIWRRGRSVAGGAAVVLAPVVVFFAIHRALGLFWDSTMESNVREVWARLFGPRTFHTGAHATFWKLEPGLVVVSAVAPVWRLVVGRARRARERDILLLCAVMVLPLLLLPLYAQLAAVVLPFLVLAPVAVLQWSRSADRAVACLLAATAAVVLASRPPRPPAHGTHAHQRAILERVLKTTGRDEPVVMGWPSVCAAYVFNADPKREWLLMVHPGGFVAAAGNGWALRPVLERALRAPRKPVVVLDDARIAELPRDLREALDAAYERDGCAWFPRGRSRGG